MCPIPLPALHNNSSRSNKILGVSSDCTRTTRPQPAKRIQHRHCRLFQQTGGRTRWKHNLQMCKCIHRPPRPRTRASIPLWAPAHVCMLWQVRFNSITTNSSSNNNRMQAIPSLLSGARNWREAAHRAMSTEEPDRAEDRLNSFRKQDKR